MKNILNIDNRHGSPTLHFSFECADNGDNDNVLITLWDDPEQAVQRGASFHVPLKLTDEQVAQFVKAAKQFNYLRKPPSYRVAVFLGNDDNIRSNIVYVGDEFDSPSAAFDWVASEDEPQGRFFHGYDIYLCLHGEPRWHFVAGTWEAI